MNQETTRCTRNYYLHCINNDQTTFQQTKTRIYNDLVAPSEECINAMYKNKDTTENHNDNHNHELHYQLRIDNQEIKTIKSSIFTFGRHPENDIFDKDRYISRIQCFIFIIDDSLYVMDGWSCCGTRTISVNGTKSNLKHSKPNKRTLLRFNSKDIIHLRFGPIDLIINPKECIICMDNARVIRHSCGHYVSCKTCYDQSSQSSKQECPLCCKPITNKKKIPKNKSIATYCSSATNSQIF